MARVRSANLEILHRQGFRVSPSLPTEKRPPPLRPVTEIFRRFAALGALSIYVAGPLEMFPTRTLRKMTRENSLDEMLTPTELDTIRLPRARAQVIHENTIGWKMENMVSLAWALGHSLKPSVNGRVITGKPLGTMLKRFAPHDSKSFRDMLAACTTRPHAEIVAMEDLFYCAHNAARSAQVGDPDTVPHRFDPITGCGVIHERRHALTWMLSPGVHWDNTDLST